MTIFAITGASRGLGLEFVRQISARGDTVFACVRNPDQAEGLQQLVDNKKVFAIKLDVVSENSIKEAVKEISKHAPNGIDVLINNAGILGTDSGPEKVYKTELLEIFATNVVATNEVAKEFLPLLRQRGPEQVKKIVNISSDFGSIKNTSVSRLSSYRISKSALNMLTKLQSNELAAENFIVYSSHPGWCKTDMGGEGAVLEPEESIRGQLAKLDSVTAAENGGFFDWKGDAIEY